MDCINATLDNGHQMGSLITCSKKQHAMNKHPTHIPEVMKAVRQHEAGGALVIETVPVPKPGKGEVLVKMHSSPVNPSDLALLKGGYLERNYPFVAGLEGSGRVVASGGGAIANMRKGKWVACTPDPAGDGTWAEFMKTTALHTVTLPKGITPAQGSMMLVNPLTAVALLEIAKKGHHSALVNNAAASALGKMLIRLSGKSGIPLINIVRSNDHMEELKSLGARYVLNSTEPSYEKELTQMASRLKATLLLDAVGGEASSILMRAAPHGSTLLMYARLSGQPVVADPGWMIQEGKKIEGFQLGQWLDELGIMAKLRLISRVKKGMSGPLNSPVRTTMPMEEIHKALSLYQKQMSAGKIIINFNT
jgi:NADPH:quinone reductase-like Zn-dependent oxidoreductase